MLKWMITIVSGMCIAGGASAVDYHVAKSGNNENPGTAELPFLTIQKAADTMGVGDVCIIHEGTYRESVTPPRNRTTYRSAAGETVVVSGYEPVTNWTEHVRNIFWAPLSWDLGDENQVMYDDEMMVLARWPNKASRNPYDLGAYKNSSGTTTSVSHPDIPAWNWGDGGSIYYLGKSRWTSWRRPITSAASGIVYFSTLPSSWDYEGSHSPSKGGEFFLQNILQALDSEGEWYVDDAQNRIYFWAPGGGDPDDGDVQVRRRTELFDLSGRAGITLNGLTIKGGRVDLSDAQNCVIRNCRILYGNHTIASDSGFQNSATSIKLNSGSRDNLILRNEILWGSSNGIVLKGVGNRVDNNHIGNFDYLGNYACAIENRGSNNAITRNNIFNSGRDLILGGGDGSEIGYNDLHHSNLINDDCGAIYTCCGNRYNYTRIHHNWIHDISSRNNNFNSYKATGVYLDNTSMEVIVDHNVMWNLEWSCIQINWAGEDLLIYNNTLWSNPGPESKSMGRWVNGYEINNVQVINTLANEGEFHYTAISNTCQLALTSDPFAHYDGQDFTPQPGTCPEDAGVEIPGITDGYLGAAPEVGAYEIGGFFWVPGPDWSIGDELSDDPWRAKVALVENGPAILDVEIDNLNAFMSYVLEGSTNLTDWRAVTEFDAPFEGVHDETVPVEDGLRFFRVTELFGSYQGSGGEGILDFSEFASEPHNSHVGSGSTLSNGGVAGLTVSVGSGSNGFGVSQNSSTPDAVSAPALFVYGDGSGATLHFSSPVTIPSLWTSSPSWALNNDPGGQQRITGKLNGSVVWTYVNTTASTSFFEVTAGAGQAIDELVVYPKWIGIDSITLE